MQLKASMASCCTQIQYGKFYQLSLPIFKCEAFSSFKLTAHVQYMHEWVKLCHNNIYSNIEHLLTRHNWTKTKTVPTDFGKY